jgi:hypothetical protein
MQTQSPQLYRQQLHKQDANNRLEWVKNQLEGKKIELTNILRWEDDGELIIQTAEAAS